MNSFLLNSSGPEGQRCDRRKEKRTYLIPVDTKVPDPGNYHNYINWYCCFAIYRSIMKSMEWLNYHHLLYFWLVAREGSLAGAGTELGLSQSAVSGQIRALENSLGEKLFVKSGRRLLLSETGRMVYRYANEIFSLGRELQDALKDRPMGRPLRVTIGVADVVPKLIARELIEPALQASRILSG